MSNAEEAKGKLHHVPGRCHHMAIGKAKSSQRQTVGPKPIEEDVESVVLRIPRIPHPGTGGPKVAGGADDSVWRSHGQKNSARKRPVLRIDTSVPRRASKSST